VLTKLFEHSQTVEIGQAEIEENGVVRLGSRKRDARASRFDLLHAKVP
jgi:hypothetical protein